MKNKKCIGASAATGSEKRKIDLAPGQSVVGRPLRKQRAGLPEGFTLLELLAAVVIMAIVMAVAMMAFSSTVPAYQLRSSAKSLLSVLQSARLQANNVQKPVRVAIDCRDHASSSSPAKPCTVKTYVATFKNTGILDSWRELPMTGRQISGVIDIESGSDSSPVKDNDANLFWAVFLPTGRVLASHQPFHLVFSSRNVRSDTHWEVAVSDISGRAALNKK